MFEIEGLSDGLLLRRSTSVDGSVSLSNGFSPLLNIIFMTMAALYAIVEFNLKILQRI
jgi:hypothetical protein